MSGDIHCCTSACTLTTSFVHVTSTVGVYSLNSSRPDAGLQNHFACKTLCCAAGAFGRRAQLLCGMVLCILWFRRVQASTGRGELPPRSLAHLELHLEAHWNFPWEQRGKVGRWCLNILELHRLRTSCNKSSASSANERCHVREHQKRT